MIMIDQIQNTKMRAVIYARVSTEEQAKHNFSLESQVDLSRKWVIDHHFELACEPFVDAGESAKTMNRKALVRLLEYCRTHKGKVDAVLIYKIDRIARNMADHVAIRSLLSQYGVRIYSVTEPIGGDNSTSKLLENVMASFAQFDNDAKSERTKDGINKRVSKGEISWVAPIGYNNVMKPGGSKTIVPDPERAPLVKKLFEEYAKGIYKSRRSPRWQIAWDLLQAKEIKSDSRLFTKCFGVKSIPEHSSIRVQKSRACLNHSSPPNYLNGSSFIYALKAADSPIIRSVHSTQTFLSESLPDVSVVAGLPEAGREASWVDVMPITTVPSVTRKASRKKYSSNNSWSFSHSLLPKKRKWACSEV